MSTPLLDQAVARFGPDPEAIARMAVTWYEGNGQMRSELEALLTESEDGSTLLMILAAQRHGPGYWPPAGMDEFHQKAAASLAEFIKARYKL